MPRLRAGKMAGKPACVVPFCVCRIYMSSGWDIYLDRSGSRPLIFPLHPIVLNYSRTNTFRGNSQQPKMTDPSTPHQQMDCNRLTTTTADSDSNSDSDAELMTPDPALQRAISRSMHNSRRQRRCLESSVFVTRANHVVDRDARVTRRRCGGGGMRRTCVEQLYRFEEQAGSYHD
jgi:hypothetical protein